MFTTLLDSRSHVFRASCTMIALVAVAMLWSPGPARAANTRVQHYTGNGRIVTPCFKAGDEVGVVFDLPASEYPLEITEIGIAWGSSFAAAGQSIEQAIHVYAGAAPDSVAPFFTLPSPLMTNGVINTFDVDGDNVLVASGPFTVSLEFANNNAGDMFAPSIAHDGNGCGAGSVVFTDSSGWDDASAMGFSGDWVMYVEYRSVNCVSAVGPGHVEMSNININQTACTTIQVANTGCDTLVVTRVNAVGAQAFAVDTTATARAIAPGDHARITVCVTPPNGEMIDCSITVVSNAWNSPTVIDLTCLPNSGPTAVGTSKPTFAITGVVPNPFNPETAIHFRLPAAARVTAEVWSVDGARVRTLSSGATFGAGANLLRWDGRNDDGQPAASGVYLVRIRSGSEMRVARAVLLK